MRPPSAASPPPNVSNGSKKSSKENFSIRHIKLYSQSGMLENALEVFDEMPDRNCERTVKSMNAFCQHASILASLCEMEEWKERWISLTRWEEKEGVEPDLITFNTLLDNLYKIKRFGDGEKIWKQMVVNKLSPNIRSYNARLVGLAKEKKFKEAVELIGEMEKSGIKPDVFTYAALIRGYCDEGDLNEVEKWYGEFVSIFYLAKYFGST